MLDAKMHAALLRALVKKGRAGFVNVLDGYFLERVVISLAQIGDYGLADAIDARVLKILSPDKLSQAKRDV